MGRLTGSLEGARVPGPLPLPVDEAAREERKRRIAEIGERLGRGAYRVAPELVAVAILRDHGRPS
ncbi:hypothetical protein HQ535_13735 [bacterium]|nr:hypothetical protein [bacterium]